MSAVQAVAIARSQSKIQRELQHGPLIARPYLFGGTGWLVQMFRGADLRAQVNIDGRSGSVQWADVGREVDWPPIVHGERTAAARRLHVAMLIAGLLFLLPFVDLRRLGRLRHLDLLAVLALGVSFAFAERGEVYTATPLIYPPLLYLLARFLWLALRGSRGEGRLTWMSPRALLIGLAALLVARYAYVAVDGAINDVGYASVVGADSIIHGFPLYDSSAGSGHLDAYGPVAYLAYVPFVLLLPLHNLSHSSATAAQLAACVFDLATVGALYAIGRRLRPGRDGAVLGLALGWAFAACPWTLFALARATNDGLVALALTLALLAASSPILRGVAVAVGAATKFAPLVVGALFARTGRERGLRPILIYGAALVLTIVVVVVAYLPDGGIREFYDSTIGFQLSRSSPFSMWGLHPTWEPLRPVVSAFAAMLAVGAFFLPRDRSVPALAATGAALILATQLSAIHWYWFYVPWFLPYALVAFFSRSYAGSVRNSGRSSESAVATNSS